MTPDQPDPPLRVVVVDDHPMFRHGLVGLLDAIERVEVVGQAATAPDAETVIADTAPDVVLMDLNLPGVTGTELTAILTREHPDVAVLALTMVEDQAAIVDTIRAGARGYLLKEAAAEEIVGAIEAVAAGQAVFGGAAATRVLSTLATTDRPGTAFPELSEREHEVLDLVARGLTNTAIAQRLHVTPKTVRNHVSNLYTKLGVADRAAAVARARDAGLGTRRPTDTR